MYRENSPITRRPRAQGYHRQVPAPLEGRTVTYLPGMKDADHPRLPHGGDHHKTFLSRDGGPHDRRHPAIAEVFAIAKEGDPLPNQRRADVCKVRSTARISGRIASSAPIRFTGRRAGALTRRAEPRVLCRRHRRGGHEAGSLLPLNVPASRLRQGRRAGNQRWRLRASVSAAARYCILCTTARRLYINGSMDSSSAAQPDTVRICRRRIAVDGQSRRGVSSGRRSRRRSSSRHGSRRWGGASSHSRSGSACRGRREKWITSPTS